MKQQFLLFGLLLLMFSSCTKEEGIGGKNTIIGTVVQEVYENDTLVNSYPLPEKDVYIIYGNQGSFADLAKTNFDGTFRFENLHKGDYKVFTYSACPNCPSGTEPIFEQIELPNRNEEVFADTLFVKKYN